MIARSPLALILVVAGIVLAVLVGPVFGFLLILLGVVLWIAAPWIGAR